MPYLPALPKYINVKGLSHSRGSNPARLFHTSPDRSGGIRFTMTFSITSSAPSCRTRRSRQTEADAPRHRDSSQSTVWIKAVCRIVLTGNEKRLRKDFWRRAKPLFQSDLITANGWSLSDDFTVTLHNFPLVCRKTFLLSNISFSHYYFYLLIHLLHGSNAGNGWTRIRSNRLPLVRRQHSEQLFITTRIILFTLGLNCYRGR